MKPRVLPAVQPLVDKVLRRTPLGADGGTVLELDLGLGVTEAAPSNPLEALRSLHTPLLRTVVENLRKAATDDTVTGLIATVGPHGLTLAQSGELREAVAAFRASGRVTLAWSPSFGELVSDPVGYHLATAFEEVWLQPTGTLGLGGFAGEALFLGGAFEQFGVQPQFGQRHEFKTAADTLMRSEMSDPHREMVERLLASFTDTLVAGVATARGLDPAVVRVSVEEGSLDADVARERGFVDRLGYRDEAYAALRGRVLDGRKRRRGADDVRFRYVQRLGSSKWEAVLAPLQRMRGDRPVIGVVSAVGAIHLGRTAGRGPAVGSDALSAALRAAAEDDQVRAVVLRIDSPGGSYIASDAIRRELLVLRRSGKPVIASMASVAASGGYYIAMPADVVVAGPGTITGSIGVLGGKLVVREGLARLGIRRETVAGSRHAAMFSTNQAFDEQQLALLDAWLDDVYADFTAKAAADRGLAVEELREHAKGRVWSGADAQARGLVDTLGGLETALAAALDRTGLSRDEVAVTQLPAPNPLQALLPADNSDDVTAGAVAALAVDPTPGLLEGPALWRRLLPELAGAVGPASAGVLSLPPMRLPGLLPRF